MKRLLILMLLFLILTACSQTEAAPTTISTPIPPTATAVPTATNTPEPTLTPTPVPYYLEDGSLYDLDETTSEYALVAEGIADITTSTDGLLVARGEDGADMYKYNADASEWEAVVKEYEYCSQAVPDVEVKAEQKLGKSLHEGWLRGMESPAYTRGFGLSEGVQGRSFMSLGYEIIKDEKDGEIFCLYGYGEEPQSTVPIPAYYIDSAGVVHNIAKFIEFDTQDIRYENSQVGLVNSRQKVVELMDRIEVGDIVYMRLLTDVDESRSGLAEWIDRLRRTGRWESIEPYISNEYRDALKGNDQIADALKILKEKGIEHMGLFAFEIDIMLNNVSDGY